jgi:dephospho-CoA kinase
MGLEPGNIACQVVALTGGIAAGKSGAAAAFSSRGVAIIDADVAARELVQPGQPALREIVERFGPLSLLQSGELDRKYLRDRVFADATQRHVLEGILHPRIADSLHAAAVACTDPYCIVAIPLLVETWKDYRWVNRVIVVDVSVEIQIGRLMQRDKISRDAALRALSTQASRAQRLALADDVIDNTGEPAILTRVVERLDLRYRVLADGKSGRQ